MTHSTRVRGGPLNSSTLKMELSPRKSDNQLESLKNISFEPDHTEPKSTLSPLGFPLLTSLGDSKQKAF
ncbi:hypothetical protein LOAG_07503 [Loa loa]|uniref:Uncharacterized protein n=1 Tax=Loa loa TaxID=7209 RepID=A0A1S0TVS1_LOALO|nr:hypothetical protein LOAG_07503 [Loa loa]EFO20989.1 hypothetical protein LOAG_07503 [Loa loa]